MLADALALGSQQGYLRVFADEGEPMRTLLARVGAAQRTGDASVGGVPRDYLIGCFGASPLPTTARRWPG